MTQKFTAEEVRKEADFLSTYSRKPAEMLTAYADTLSKPADSGRVDANCMDVLRRLRDMLPTVGICGWPAGVSALDEAISTLAAQGQREAVAKVRHFDYRGIARNGFSQEAEMLDGAPVLPDGTPLYTRPATAASPAGVPDVLIHKALTIAANIRTADWLDAGGTLNEQDALADYLAAAPSAPEGDGGAE